MMVNEKSLPDRPAPVARRGIVGWLRDNLFDGPANTVLTLAGLVFLWFTLAPFVQWAVIDADWLGDSRMDCDSGGACWVFIGSRLQQFIYGFYPDSELWRVNLFFIQLAVVIVWVLWDRMPARQWGALWFLTGFPISSWWLLYGGPGFPVVETHYWGGLMLTLVLALVGMVFALPAGIVLALGRRSDMPLIRALSVVFIEVWRGVPLITILFMASVMLPLFVPEEIDLNKLVRAMIGIILFEAALLAEVIRGGMQAIPKGQYEAAAAIGLGYWRGMGLVVMPQVLKICIPGIVNTFVALFKDTSLVLIIGLFDLLAIVQAGLNDPKWLGFASEGYLFAGFVFWAFCFGMSRYSLALERKLDTGHKNS